MPSEGKRVSIQTNVTARHPPATDLQMLSEYSFKMTLSVRITEIN